MRGLTDRLIAFNSRYGRPVRLTPTVELPEEEIAQFVAKLDEEIGELNRAIEQKDLTGIADGLGDAVYVIAGIAVQYGLDVDALVDIVHRSNMTKEHDEDRGPVKGASYRQPEIEGAIAAMRLRDGKGAVRT